MVNVGVWCAATFLPSLLLLWYFIRSDRFPEPTGVLVKTFLLGLLITIPVIIAEDWFRVLSLMLVDKSPKHW